MDVDGATQLSSYDPASTVPLDAGTVHGSSLVTVRANSNPPDPNLSYVTGEAGGIPVTSAGPPTIMTATIATTASIPPLSPASSVFVISSSPHLQHISAAQSGLHASEILTLGQHSTSHGLQTLITGTHVNLPPMTTSYQFDLPSSILSVNPQSAHGYPVLWLTNPTMEPKVSDNMMRLPPVSEVRSSRLPKLQRHKEADLSQIGDTTIGIQMTDIQRAAMNAYIAAQIKQQQDSIPLPPVSELNVCTGTDSQMVLANADQMAGMQGNHLIATTSVDGGNLHLVTLSSASSMFPGGTASNIYSVAPSQISTVADVGSNSTCLSIGTQMHQHHHHQHVPTSDAASVHTHQLPSSMLSHVTTAGHVLLPNATDPLFSTGAHSGHQMTLTAADLLDSMVVCPPRLQVEELGSLPPPGSSDEGFGGHQYHKPDPPGLHSLPSLQMLPQGTLEIPLQPVVTLASHLSNVVVTSSTELEQTRQHLHHHHGHNQHSHHNHQEKDLEPDCNDDDSGDLDDLVETLACYRCKACPYISLSKEGVENHVRSTHMKIDMVSKRERRTPTIMVDASTSDREGEETLTPQLRSGVIREPGEHPDNKLQHHHHAGHHQEQPPQQQMQEAEYHHHHQHHPHLHHHQPLPAPAPLGEPAEQLQRPPLEEPPPVPCKDDTFICGMCEKGFTNIESCSLHMAVEHNVPVDNVHLEPIDQSGPIDRSVEIASDPVHHSSHHNHHHHHQSLPSMAGQHLQQQQQHHFAQHVPQAAALSPPHGREEGSIKSGGTALGVAAPSPRRPARRRLPKKASKDVSQPQALPSSPLPSPPHPPIMELVIVDSGQSQAQCTVAKIEELDECDSYDNLDNVAEVSDESESSILSNEPDDPKSPTSKKRGRPKGSKTLGLTLQRRKALRSSEDHGLGLRCAINNCGIRMQSQENMEYHRRCHIEDTDKYECPECKEKCSHWKTMSIHLWRLHVVDMELYACDLCSYKTYSYGKLMNMHRRIHSEERPFLCDICGKGFKTNKQLRNHKVIHLDKRRYRSYRSGECDVCQRHFSDKRMLRVHKDTVHNKLRPFLCNFCGYAASCRSTLKMHVRQHTGEKPFACNICEYRTADHNSLRRHKMRHSGEKPYKCPRCPYACIQSSTYKTHLRNKHPGLDEGLIFCCDRCSFRTIKRENFVTHVADHRQEDEADASAPAPDGTSCHELLQVPVPEALTADDQPPGRRRNASSLYFENLQHPLDEHCAPPVSGSPNNERDDGDGCFEELKMGDLPIHHSQFIYSVPDAARNQHSYKVEMNSSEERFPILASQLKMGQMTSEDTMPLHAAPKASHRGTLTDDATKHAVSVEMDADGPEQVVQLEKRDHRKP